MVFIVKYIKENDITESDYKSEYFRILDCFLVLAEAYTNLEEKYNNLSRDFRALKKKVVDNG